jgi:hypothetical protein
MHFVTRKMKHCIADHHIRKSIRERHLFDEADVEILPGQPGHEGRGELADMVDTGGIRVHGEDFATLAKQMHQVASIPASGVDHAHSGCDVATQNLIEHINIDLAELFLDG